VEDNKTSTVVDIVDKLDINIIIGDNNDED